VREARYHAALRAVAKLMSDGKVMFSPIAHTHPVDQYVPRELATKHEFWMSMDIPILRHAAELIVLTLPGWDLSRGVAEEMSVAKEEGIPVGFMEPIL